MWELKPWVNAEMLTIHGLHSNYLAYDYLLENHMDDINWKKLCNRATDDTLISIPDECVDWIYVSANPTVTAIHRLKQNPSKIDWYYLLSNSMAINIIIEKFDKIKKLQHIITLSQNKHPKAVELLSNNMDKIDWNYLSSNPSAIDLLQKYPEKINWVYLSLNSNPKAIEMLVANPTKIKWDIFNHNPSPLVVQYLKEHPERIVWASLCLNPYAEELIVQNIDKIVWTSLSINPCIFMYNYKKCRTVYRTTLLKEEIMARALHPDKISKYLSMGYTFDDF
jgi:hypothetical protein